MVYPNLLQEIASKLEPPETPQSFDENLAKAVLAIVTLAENGAISTKQRDQLISNFVAAIVAHKVETMVSDLAHAVLSVSGQPNPTPLPFGTGFHHTTPPPPLRPPRRFN